MDIFEELGVPTLINAAGPVTRYGGSLMAPAVIDAMRDASGKFCKLDDLHVKVGERIASMLNVEAAYVTASASSGIVLTTAAAMAGCDPERIAQLPDTTGMKCEVVIQKSHRIAYDQAIRIAGATLIEVPDDGTPPRTAMRAAITERTAAIFCMAHQFGVASSLSIEELVSLGREKEVPVIVDSASECPPVSTLSTFCKAGANLVIFSGGKSLMGPQSTGLVVGQPDLIAACAANGNPFAAVGRPMKVSREEIIGFLKALELYMVRDHAGDQIRWESQVMAMESKLRSVAGIELMRISRSETYQVPLLGVRPLPKAGFSRTDLIAALETGDPKIIVAEYVLDDGIVINPHMLLPGQETIVADCLAAVITQLGA